jgi:CHAT domain-containing protein/tetratricopeptide (TPR) repeat protein
VDDRQVRMTQAAVSVFVRQEYGQCVRFVSTVFPTTTLMMMQMMLISLQRMARDHTVALFIDEHLPNVKKYPWEHALLSLTLGLIDSDAVAGLVIAPEQAAEFHCYWGSRLLTLGEVGRARREFQSCIQVAGEYPEQKLAAAQLNWPSQHPGEEDPFAKLERLNRRSADLLRTADSHSALQAAQETYLLAERILPWRRDRLTITNNYAIALLRSDDAEAAADLCVEALFLLENSTDESLGKADVARWLFLLATALEKKGDFQQAVEHLREALDILEESGTDLQAIQRIRLRLADDLIKLDRSGEAEPLAQQSLDAELQRRPRNDEAIVAARARLASNLNALDRFDDAERQYQAILGTMASSAGRLDVPYIRVLLDYVYNRMQARDYTSALSLSEELERKVRALTDIDLSLLIQTLFLRAVLLLDTGKPGLSIVLFEEALERQADSLTSDPSLNIEIHRRLADAYRELGDNAAALGHLRTVVRQLRTDGPSSELPLALHNLGINLIGLRKSRDAIDVLTEALELLRQTNDRRPEDEAAILNALGVATIDSRQDPERAENYLIEASQLDATVPGKDAEGVSSSLINLVKLYLSRENIEGATKLLDKLDLSIGPRQGQSIEYAALLTVKGETQLRGGNFAAAEDLLRRALQAHPGTTAERDMRANTLLDLCIALTMSDKRREALEVALEAMSLLSDSLIDASQAASEHERLFLLNGSYRMTSTVLTLMSSQFATAPEARKAAWEFLIRTKAIAIEAMAVQRSMNQLTFDDPARAVAEELAEKRKELAALELTGLSVNAESHVEDDVYQAYDEARKQLRSRIADLEERIGTSAHSRAALQFAMAVTADEIAAAIPQHSLLIEFVKFRMIPFAPASGMRHEPEHSESYGAFVIRGSAEPSYIDLGDASHIDQLVKDVHEKFGFGGQGTRGDQIEFMPIEVRDDPLEQLSIALRPVLAELSDPVAQLIVVPDGELTRLPIGALRNPSGSALVDIVHISYLDASRDLLPRNLQAARQSMPSVVVAAPDFNLASLDDGTDSVGTAVVNPSRMAGTTRPFITGASRQAADLSNHGIQFADLPGTRLEAEAVTNALGGLMWVGRKALKSQVLNLQSPFVLHLATHGYFLESDAATTLDIDFGILVDIAPEHTIGGRLSGGRLGNPLLRSGLAFAGANTWLKSGELHADVGNGLLTAEDVAGMNLHGTELVVLSACDTGLGSVRVGDGILGLRRAALLAGARAVVMTLWKVPDFTAAVLIRRFYDNLLDAKQTIDGALSEAQAYVRDVTVRELCDKWLAGPYLNLMPTQLVEWLRSSHEGLRPFRYESYWAGFIYVGTPHRLESLSVAPSSYSHK